MIADFTDETVFSFEGPNLCFLGKEEDFRKLSDVILELTDVTKTYSIELASLSFIQNDGSKKNVFFISKKGASRLGVFDENDDLIFELDHHTWKRLFKFFVLMSWYKRPYYLNNYESCLEDLELEQECNFICSSSY